MQRMLGQNTWLAHLHSFVSLFIRHTFFIWIRGIMNLSVLLWGFTSFLRIPSSFLEMPTWYLHSAQLIIDLHSVTEATFQWRCVIAAGEEKEKNIFYVNLIAANMISCSVLHGSVRSCSLILAGNSGKPETNPLGCTSWRLLMSPSLLDPSLQKSV